jgi:hypothetical protein
LPPPASIRRAQLALDLVDQVEVELKEPAQEADHDRQIGLAVRELYRAANGVSLALPAAVLRGGFPGRVARWVPEPARLE